MRFPSSLALLLLLLTALFAGFFGARHLLSSPPYDLVHYRFFPAKTNKKHKKRTASSSVVVQYRVLDCRDGGDTAGKLEGDDGGGRHGCSGGPQDMQATLDVHAQPDTDVSSTAIEANSRPRAEPDKIAPKGSRITQTGSALPMPSLKQRGL